MTEQEPEVERVEPHMLGRGKLPVREHGNAYNIFILVLTIMSLAIMGLLLLPLDAATLQVLLVYDNLICVIFLIDFALNLSASQPRSDYFIHRRGWLDLLGSIPAFGVFPAAALFRLFRLSRLARIVRLLRGDAKKALIADIIQNRSQYAVFITILSAMIVLVVSSVLVLQFEGRSPNANITTGGDALWWSIVTITTVGYGDFYPVTSLGRVTGVFVMFTGVGIIGALASILASVLVPDAPAPAEPEQDAGAADPSAATVARRAAAPAVSGDMQTVATSDAVVAELASIKAELSALRQQLAAGPTQT